MKSHIFPISILLFLILIFFHKIIFTTQLISGVDITTLNLPLKAFLNNAAVGKESPLWNPYTYCGIPFIAQVQPAVFYPLDIIFRILSLPIAMNICTWFHIFLSGAFTYFFARELKISRFGALISGIIFSFNGYQFAHLVGGHTPILRTLPWIPAILYCLERSISKQNLFYALTGGILLSTQIFAGFPQITFYTLIVIVFYSIARGFRNIGFPSVIILTGLLAGAIQILPVMEIMPYTTKCCGANFNYLNVSSFPPLNLLTFIITEIFGDGIKVKYWGEWYFGEVMGYMGILPLIAMIIASCLYRTRITMICLAFMLIFLLIAFGGYLPGAENYYCRIPGFNIFRCSARAMIMFDLFGGILSGYGIAWIVENQKRLRGMLKWLISFSLIYGIIVAWFCLPAKGEIFWYRLMQLIASSGRVVEIPQVFLLSIGFISDAYSLSVYGAIKSFLLLIISTAVLYLWSKQWLSMRLFKSVVITILVVDLYLFGYKYIQLTPDNDIRLNQKTIEFLKKDNSCYRICMLQFLSNAGQRYGLCQADGFESSISKRYNELINVCNNMPLETPLPLVKFSRWHNLHNLLNIKYIIGPTNIKMIGLPHLKHIFSSEYNNIYQNLTCLPRAFITYDFEVHKPEDVLKRLTEDSFDLLRCVILEEKPGIVSQNANTKNIPKILRYSLDEVIIQAELKQPGILVLTDAWYPGWQAYIDDKKTKIYIANYVFRAIELTAGKHRIRFVYQPKSILYGMIITLVTLGIVVIVIIRRRLAALP